MRSFQSWMDEYAESHQNPTNIVIHKICVPLIMFSVVGIIEALTGGGLVFVVLCLGFYLSLNFKIFLGMLVQTALILGLCYWLKSLDVLLITCVVIFVLAWIGQFYGHKIEGKKPSFLKDILFLLIGPLWVTKFVYNKLGIRI